jgi:hypothetical protein
MAHAIALAGRRGDGQHDRLQIDAEPTGIPWSILYDAKAYAHARKTRGEPVEPRHEARPARPEDVDLSSFWGYRFDIFHDYSVDSFPSEVLGTTTPLAQAVLNGSFCEVSDRQKALFTAGGGALADLVQCNPVLESAQDFLDWAKAGADQPCDLLYLFCHAWAPSEFLDSGLRSSAYNARESYLGLEQSAATAKAGRVTIQQLEDASSEKRDRQPLVFLHACGSGENDATYGRPFVEHFLGTWLARALVGTEWTVPTDFADSYSREILAAFARPGTAIVDALRQASDVAFAQGNVFPLIYALFGRNDLCLGKG